MLLRIAVPALMAITARTDFAECGHNAHVLPVSVPSPYGISWLVVSFSRLFTRSAMEIQWQGY